MAMAIDSDVVHARSNLLLMFTNQKPLAATTRGSIRLRMSLVGQSAGGFSCAKINTPTQSPSSEPSFTVFL